MAQASAAGAAGAAATALSMDGSSGDDVGRAASSATCVLRWRNGLIAAAVILSCALQGVSAEDEQLLVPEVVFEEPEESETTGIAYSPQSGVLYEVGTRSVLHPRQAHLL